MACVKCWWAACLTWHLSLIINLDSQRNFPYLEASGRDLILAELDWNVQVPVSPSQLLPSVAVLGTLGKTKSFLSCSRTQGSESVCVSVIIPAIPHAPPGGCLGSDWVSSMYRLLCCTSCWGGFNPACSKMTFWNFLQEGSGLSITTWWVLSLPHHPECDRAVLRLVLCFLCSLWEALPEFLFILLPSLGGHLSLRQVALAACLGSPQSGCSSLDFGALTWLSVTSQP